MKLFKKIKLGVIIVASIIFILAASYGWFSIVYAQRIYPGIIIDEIDFSGFTKEQASDLIKNRYEEIKDSNVTLSYNEKKWGLSPKQIELTYDIDETVNTLYQAGRENGFWKNLINRIEYLFTNQNIKGVYSYNLEELNNFLSGVFSQIEIPVIDSSLEYENETLKIIPEQAGKEVNRFKLDGDLNSVFADFKKDKHIDLVADLKYPKITSLQVEQIKDGVSRIITSEIKLTSDFHDEIAISRQKILEWVDLVAKYQSKTTDNVSFFGKAYAIDENQYVPNIYINQEKIKLYVEEIAKKINQDPINAKLIFSDNKAKIFNPETKGYELKKDETIQAISDLLMLRLQVAGISTNNDHEIINKEIKLEITVKDPKVNEKNIESLGLKELIATATTDFKGSPANRIHNIRKGAELFNGILIGSDDVLSAIKTIGNPSAETGFLPELVIKDNETKPEYGGGLCQVSTTLFRAALNAGMEILERTNHSYRVSYYEPPVGMDATVYYPNPDLKIKNNTSAYILIQTKIQGTKITFDLYGTKDGRSVEISDPTLYDVTNPPPDLYIESSNLAQGQTKRLERAHNGAKSDFYYKVTLNDKVIFEKKFHSVYKPWQARYLVGTGTPIPSDQKPQEEKSNDQGDSSEESDSNSNEPESSPEPSPESTSSSPSPTSTAPTTAPATSTAPTTAPTTTSPSPSPTP